MADGFDWFGRKTLKKAAAGPPDPAAPQGNQDAGLDMKALAAQSAAQRLAPPPAPAKPPAAAPVTPPKKKKVAGLTDQMGSNMAAGIGV